MGKVKRRRLRRKKGSQPRLAALSSPFQGKGLAWMLPPSFGRRCPEGAEVGGGKRYPRHTVFPSRGRCPEGADRVALRYIPHCSITASMPLLPSALPPKGEARRYVTNDFLNLIALPMRRRLIWRRLRREYMGRCPKSGIQVTSHQSLATKSPVPSSPSSGSPYRARRSQCVDRPQRSRTPVRASLYSPLRDGYRSGRCDGRRCRSHEGRACRGRIRSA